MFVAAEFQSIRRLCLSDLEKLLEKLSITIPDWSGNEYRIYEQLDDDITKKICAAVKSSSVIEGYTNLLKLGGIAYDYSETDNELLDKIILNGDKILDAVRIANDDYDLWHAKWSDISPELEVIEKLDLTAVNAEYFNPGDFVFNLKTAKALAKRDSPKSNAVHYLSDCLAKAESFNNLLKFTGSRVRVEDVNDFVQRISAKLHEGEEHTICLTIKKSVERHKKEIPPAPPKPSFTVREVEDALKILIQVNEIIKKI
ncbi:MAG: hypothetical protein IKZ53_04250 [Selenomonadaceae bacterium]|nr:hypothetical protein [Selenomonadaceae bacterium]